ncbi:hypothetical protein CDV49_03540 [Haematobacter genomosp. 1]|uniref:Uncharacterized protein n=1 Tax=Haematobacter genomosp. 1 TaxID=366618 RepID=A0A212AES2_9RHOB|nr:hypothetical protein CDV49_03540 [Haematobacter genomosp. 1]
MLRRLPQVRPFSAAAPKPVAAWESFHAIARGDQQAAENPRASCSASEIGKIGPRMIRNMEVFGWLS